MAIIQPSSDASYPGKSDNVNMRETLPKITLQANVEVFSYKKYIAAHGTYFATKGTRT